MRPPAALLHPTRTHRHIILPMAPCISRRAGLPLIAEMRLRGRAMASSSPAAPAGKPKQPRRNPAPQNEGAASTLDIDGMLGDAAAVEKLRGSLMSGMAAQVRGQD